MTCPQIQSPSFAIRRLDTVGYKEVPPMRPGASDSWCFCYLISGQVLTEVCGETFLQQGRQFLLVPPGLPFRILWFRSSIGYMGRFSTAFPEDRGYRVLSGGAPVRISFRTEDEGLMDELMYKLFRERDNLRMRDACLDFLLRQLDDNLPAYRSGSLCNTFLDRLFDRERIPATVSAYAAEAGVSPGYLNRRVKAYTGRSAGEWIDIARVARAKELLRQPSVPVIDIAARVGLDDQSYFSRFFRKQTGMTPSQYRRQEAAAGEDRDNLS